MENPIAEEIIDIVQNELLFEKIEVAVLPELYHLQLLVLNNQY